VKTVEDIVRRTTTDAVFEKLHEEIVSLKILPGTKLSEVEVARRFGVSRQPVRNAFTKLGNQDLLLIRPQKATEIRGFSLERIATARLVRMSVELEVIRTAIEVWDTEKEAELAKNVALQSDALQSNEFAQFHALDYHFHRLICDLSGMPYAFEVIQECKQKLNRLCALSFNNDREAGSILTDHKNIAKGIASRDLEGALGSVRKHLTRLDATIEFIHKTHPNFFE